ncbi:MAG: histidine phosphatase family protein [Spirochaetes bacterium]|nr:histidine phosphatase family protein [Spirochaetota bacterium]
MSSSQIHADTKEQAENNITVTTILAVRHGETEWNRIGKQQGHLDSNLTALGLEQARRTGDQLARLSCDVIYCSALGRAIRTAEIIARRTGLEIARDSGLNERNLGIVQGHTLKEFAAAYPDEYERYISNDPDYIIPGGESVRQRYERTMNAVKNITGRNAGKTLILVMHGGNLDSLFRYVLDIPLQNPRNFSLVNGSINTFSVENDAWKVASWGEVSHLLDIGALDDF